MATKKTAKKTVKKTPKTATPKPLATARSELTQFYREMLLIRRFEEKAGQLYGMGQIAGFCHLYIGQEAVVVGCRAGMKTGDQMITGYRDHGHMLACGMESRGVKKSFMADMVLSAHKSHLERVLALLINI